MIRSFRVAAALAAISLSACSPVAKTPEPKGVNTGKRTFDIVAFDNNDGHPNARVFHDRLTGCEIVVFTYNGVGTYPRMEPDAVGEGRHQRCVKAAATK